MSSVTQRNRGLESMGPAYVDGVLHDRTSLQHVRVAITSAQIKALFTTPVQVLAAPGSGKVVVPVACAINFKYGTVQYTSGGAVSLVDHGTTNNVMGSTVAAATIQGAASVYTMIDMNGAMARPANTGIDIVAATANFATGDGTITVDLWYTVVTP